MEDITLLFITANNVPDEWAKFHLEVLLKAAKGKPILTISRKPMPGVNLLDDGEPGPLNFYHQILRGAKAATTSYVALVEDDTLYTEDHFNYRPRLDSFAYNMGRWSVYTWGEATYSFRQGSMCGCAGIYPRELAVESLEERFTKYGDDIPIKVFGELGRYERNLGVTVRRVEQFYSNPPIIQMAHHYFSLHENTPEAREHIHRKRMGWIRATDIPYWGRAEKYSKIFQ